MGAAHFFVGMTAGIAILSVPVMTIGPGRDLPRQIVAWIDSPAPQILPQADSAAAARPARGFRPGDPTPGPDSAPPTVAPAAPTPTPLRAVAAPTPVAFAQMPAGGVRTGVIRGNGTPVYVRKAAGVASSDDPVLPDGSPVLVSAGGALQIGPDAWRAVRGLNGIVGWVPNNQVAVDGEAPPPAPSPTAPVAVPPGTQLNVAGAQATPAAIGTPMAAAERGRIANTGGVGVVLRNSPNDADRSRTGLMDGASVAVVERNGAKWVHVHTDAGQDGWVPAQYVAQQ